MMTAQGVPGGGVISVEGLCMRYRTLDVLRDVAFQVRRGEVLALLGPNGAGKTTTVEILEGFRRPSAGQVRVLGANPLTADRRWRARTGIVLQSWQDHGKWRVREFLAYQASYYRPYAAGQAPGLWDADDLLAAVGLAGQARTPVRRLSGGQRRRLDLAIAVAGRPELLFLDEPTAGLDPQARREFHDLLTGIRCELGTTVLMTTHDLDEAGRLAGRIIILAGGLIELRQAFSGAALAGQLLWPGATLAALFLFRHRELAGSSFTIGAVMLPGTLGMFVAFGMMLMVQYLPADREDGTLLRTRATPGGIGGYLAGKLVTSSLSVLIYLAMIGVPGAFITGGLHLADIFWGRLAWVLILGMTGTQLLGAALGALVPSPRCSPRAPPAWKSRDHGGLPRRPPSSAPGHSSAWSSRRWC
jgi:ABC-2 type transport system ATP-binding protein